MQLVSPRHRNSQREAAAPVIGGGSSGGVSSACTHVRAFDQSGFLLGGRGTAEFVLVTNTPSNGWSRPIYRRWICLYTGLSLCIHRPDVWQNNLRLLPSSSSSSSFLFPNDYPPITHTHPVSPPERLLIRHLFYVVMHASNSSQG